MRKRLKARRIDEEVVCVDALINRLKSLGCTVGRPAWETNDPPDCWLTVDDERFAVEITSIAAGQDYYADLCRLKQEIQHQAVQESLPGRFALIARKSPRIPKPSSPRRTALRNNALRFMRNSQDEDPIDTIELLDCGGSLAIGKLAAEGAGVGLIGPTTAKWEGEARDELHKLMQDAITRKRSKLERKQVAPHRSILAFYDAYGWSDAGDAQDALLRTAGFRSFHSVLWAESFTDRPNELDPGHPGRRGCFLYSIIPSWLAVAPGRG